MQFNLFRTCESVCPVGTLYECEDFVPPHQFFAAVGDEELGEVRTVCGVIQLRTWMTSRDMDRRLDWEITDLRNLRVALVGL